MINVFVSFYKLDKILSYMMNKKGKVKIVCDSIVHILNKINSWFKVI